MMLSKTNVRLDAFNVCSQTLRGGRRGGTESVPQVRSGWTSPCPRKTTHTHSAKCIEAKPLGEGESLTSAYSNPVAYTRAFCEHDEGKSEAANILDF